MPRRWHQGHEAGYHEVPENDEPRHVAGPIQFPSARKVRSSLAAACEREHAQEAKAHQRQGPGSGTRVSGTVQIPKNSCGPPAMLLVGVTIYIPGKLRRIKLGPSASAALK